MNAETIVVIGTLLSPLFAWTISVIVVDLTHEWEVIGNFFRYRLWREGTVEVVVHDFSRDVVVVRVGEGFHLAKGTFDGSFDYLYAGHENMHVPVPWYLSPISSLCLLVMRRVYYHQIDEAQQLINL